MYVLVNQQYHIYAYCLLHTTSEVRDCRKDYEKLPAVATA